MPSAFLFRRAVITVKNNSMILLCFKRLQASYHNSTLLSFKSQTKKLGYWKCRHMPKWVKHLRPSTCPIFIWQTENGMLFTALWYFFVSHGKLVDVVYCQLSSLTTLMDSLLILCLDAICPKQPLYKGHIRLINSKVSYRCQDSSTKWNSRRLMLKFYVFLILKQNPHQPQYFLDL